jgi:A/G-specific adenine glycosylase
LHKCAKHVSETMGGKFPSSIEKLKELPGVGDYTSAAIASIAFNKPANVVDGNVERVMARIFAVTQPVPDSKPLLKSLAARMAEEETQRPGDYAQALMDLGATICTPSSPKCMLCPVREFCDGYEQGITAELPARKAKTQKPQKHGYVYWITDNKNRVLFEKRGEKGMLGGTIGLPTSAWLDKALEKTHLEGNLKGSNSRVTVRHSFTHFDLELIGVTATAADKDLPKGGNYFWVPLEQAETLGIPTLFKKALKQFI